MTKPTHSAHFTNALKKERERLMKKYYAVGAKISPLVDQQNILNDQIRLIDEQLGDQLELPAGTHLATDEDIAAEELAVAKAA